MCWIKSKNSIWKKQTVTASCLLLIALFCCPVLIRAQQLGDDARTNAGIKALLELEKCRAQADSVGKVSDKKTLVIERQNRQRWYVAGISFVAGMVTVIIIERNPLK